MINQIEAAYYNRVVTGAEFAENEQRIADVAKLAMYSTSPLERLERGLAQWVAYFIVPTFALANAGVNLSGDTIRGIVSDRVTIGVVLGLVVGKAVEVFGATAIAVRLGLGRLPPDTAWRHIGGLAPVAGVGFTVAMFDTSLSFDDAAVTDAAKVGILIASALAGAGGYLLLRSTGTAMAHAARAPSADGGQSVSA